MRGWGLCKKSDPAPPWMHRLAWRPTPLSCPWRTPPSHTQVHTLPQPPPPQADAQRYPTPRRAQTPQPPWGSQRPEARSLPPGFIVSSAAPRGRPQGDGEGGAVTPDTDAGGEGAQILGRGLSPPPAHAGGRAVLFEWGVIYSCYSQYVQNKTDPTDAPNQTAYKNKGSTGRAPPDPRSGHTPAGGKSKSIATVQCSDMAPLPPVGHGPHPGTSWGRPHGLRLPRAHAQWHIAWVGPAPVPHPPSPTLVPGTLPGQPPA